jgi:hypothetical protein
MTRAGAPRCDLLNRKTSDAHMPFQGKYVRVMVPVWCYLKFQGRETRDAVLAKAQRRPPASPFILTDTCGVIDNFRCHKPPSVIIERTLRMNLALSAPKISKLEKNVFDCMGWRDLVSRKRTIRFASFHPNKVASLTRALIKLFFIVCPIMREGSVSPCQCHAFPSLVPSYQWPSAIGGCDGGICRPTTQIQVRWTCKASRCRTAIRNGL